ncbi:MAG TPA: YqaA family protein [Chthoniobacterales bacterium]|nr:YqaA family protein [Chthoniobacterales bacterium]
MKTEINAEPATAMELARATGNPFRKLYYWTLHWAATSVAVPALCLISFAEASFFPIPPDALLLPMCFARIKKWFSYAAWCTIFSVLGAIFGWVIGFFLWQHVSAFFFRWIPGFTPARFDSMSALYQQYGFWIIMAKGLTPIPFKLITISAGACQVSLPTLILAAAISRGARFFGLALLVRLFGESAKPFIEKYLTWVLLACFVALIGGIFVLKFLPH